MLTKDFLKGNPYIESAQFYENNYLIILFITCNSIAQGSSN